MMKKLLILALALSLFGFSNLCHAYVMGGQGACSKCYCSGFNPQSYGFSNRCTCGHWDTDHNR